MLYSNDPARPTIEERGIRIDEEEPEISVSTCSSMVLISQPKHVYST